jgi:hypothetical protein
MASEVPDDEVIEQTLHVSRSVDVFQIPPRGPSGWRSGEWLVSSKVRHSARAVVLALSLCEWSGAVQSPG